MFFLITFAGTPITNEFLGISSMTTVPAAITDHSPIVTSLSIVDLQPIHTQFSITIRLVFLFPNILG